MPYLQQQDEIIHRVVSRVQVVTRAQPVVVVKVHLLVDAGVTEQVEQNLLGHPSGAEVLHFCRGERSETRDTSNTSDSASAMKLSYTIITGDRTHLWTGSGA